MRYVKKEHSVLENPAPEEVRDPYLDGLDEAAEFIRRHTDGRVTIVGDYDADGVLSASVLCWAMRALGREPVMRLPRRMSEGYGMSPKIVDGIPSGLVIAVDNGIAAHEAVAAAKAKGLYVAVIDHHLPVMDGGAAELPPADVVLDPHAFPARNGFCEYCGAGLAYRVAERLLPDTDLSQLLVLAAAATVADVVPLVGANHTLVKDGLAHLNAGHVVPGFAALLASLGLTDHVSEGDLAFRVGPALNAPGRLYDDGAERAVKLVTAHGYDPELALMADGLAAANEERKSLVKKHASRAERLSGGRRPAVVYDDELPEGIAGIVAGRLCEKNGCPAIVFAKAASRGEDGVLKGSGRSVPGVNLKEALDMCSGLLLSYGGHAGAAGLSIREADLPAFTEAFTAAVGEIPEPPDVLYYDEEIELSGFSAACRRAASYAPFGEGNPAPVFRLRFSPSGGARVIGDGSHVMFSAPGVKVLGFGLADEYRALGEPSGLDVLGTVGEDWWNGNMTYKFEALALSES